MVGRPSVENWSRPELEDQFHSLYQQLQSTQKKVNEQNKKLTQLNTRFRRSLLDRKTKEEGVIEKDKYDEIMKENQLLTMKLKSAKHQLLTYTTPTARASTASAMTGRSTFRPMSSVRRYPLTAHSTVERSSRIETTGSEAIRAPTVRINESTLADKAGYIKLNRLVRERNAQVAQLQFEIERLNSEVHDLRSELEKKSATVLQLETAAKIADKSLGKDGEQPAEIELDLIKKQLDIAVSENVVLKEANERLVKQSLSMDYESEAIEQVELKKEIAMFQERLKEAERRESELQRKLKREKQSVEELREKEKVRPSKSNQEEKNKKTAQNADTILEYKEERKPQRKRSKKDDEHEDILSRLYRDVADILEAHNYRSEEDITESSLSNEEKLSKWQKSYAELYEELEKVRNMLLIQHNINQKQSTEINLLQEELDRAKNKYGLKLEEMKDKLLDKHKKILILEEQIRSIAYGQQKPIAIQGDKLEDAAPFTDISVHLTHIAVCDDYIAKFSANSPYFLSLEFFDFELQTTPIIQKSATSLDFTTIYNVIVSSLFVHYLKSNGVTIEMYTPRGTSYDLIAAGVISLRPLLQKGGTNKYEGYVKLISIESGLIFANLRYEINIANDLEKSIAMYEKLEAAQKVLPIEIPPDQSEFEELIIMVNRCTGLRNLSKVPMETCIVYEFFSFSPYFTDYVTSSSIAEYNSKREWKLSAKENLHNYLEEAEITFFLFENRPEKKDHDGVLAMLSLPLAPLSANRSLKGSFAMVKADGNECGVYLDVSIMWKYGLEQVKDKELVQSTYKPAEKHETVQDSRPPSTQFVTENRTSVVCTSIVEMAESPDSVMSPKAPSVSEVPMGEGQYSFGDETESISSKNSSRISEDTINIEGTPMHDELKAIKQMNTSRSTASGSRSHESIEDSDERLSPKTHTFSRTGSQESADSTATFTKEDTNDAVPLLSENLQDDRESGTLPMESSPARERNKNGIQSLLGKLPPIAKPRLSKPPSAFRSSFSGFDILSKYEEKPEAEESRNYISNIKDETENSERKRSVFFTDPLHKSIPPSETSSVSSPPPMERPPVRLPESGGRSAIKATRTEPLPDFDAEENATVSIDIDRLYLPEFSKLLNKSYDNVKVYVDWFFLDYPLEESRVSEAVWLPRVSDSPAIFGFRKEFNLSRRRVALLEQWVELGNRIDFTLITEGADSEELAVAQLELARTPTDDSTTVQFLDVNGDHLADLDIVITYSPHIFDNLKK